MSQYITNDDADTYFGTRLNTSVWDAATAGNKTKALSQATRMIDCLNFVGEKADSDQELQFPRGTDDTVPTDVQYACAELALALLDGVDPDIEYDNLRLLATNYGSVSTEYSPIFPEHIAAGIPSITAWRYLRPYIRDPQTVTLTRKN